MSVFICWSGDRSHEVARAVRTLLQSALPRLVGAKEIHVSISDEIEKGVAWFDSIIKRLQSAKAGVVCVTSENVDSPWMHFEAGALAQRVAGKQSGDEAGARPQDPRLFTLLHGLTGAALKGPLGAYQATSTTEPDVASMIRSIAHVLAGSELAASGEKPILTNDEWTTFKGTLDRIAVPVQKLIPNFESLFQRKTFHEPLNRCVDEAWLRRYDGARSTREQLVAHLDRVRAACAPHERGLFEMLLSELDAYSMAIEARLLSAKPFELADDGELKMDPGVLACCEDRRLAVRSIAGILLDPTDTPMREEAVRFMAAETNEERKMIVHRLEGAIRKQREAAFEQASNHPEGRVDWYPLIGSLTGGESPIRFRESCWDLDRIYYYLLIQYFGIAALRWRQDAPDGEPAAMQQDWLCGARDVEMEVERYRAKAKGGSLMPLTYALVALQEICRHRPPDPTAANLCVQSARDLVLEELKSILDAPSAGALARVLRELLPAGA
jgi:hypothetical protein